ncbi:MAG: ribonuclease R, partial [Oscillospiraceae bacterium]
LHKQRKKAISYKELAQQIRLRKIDQPLFLETIKDLKASGHIVEQDGRCILSKNLNLFPGEVVKITDRFGFVAAADSEKQVFIPGRCLMGAMPGDIVLIKKIPSRGQLEEGEVTRIIKKGNFDFVGIYNDGKVTPDKLVKFPLFVAKGQAKDAKNGDKVLASVCSRGHNHFTHKVSIIQVFGNAENAQTCSQAILMANGVVAEFPQTVLDEAEKIANTSIHAKEIAARTDLRYDEIFTIDGADSKDLDDAISLREHENGWHLGVHIADVSYYVLHQSDLDKEAFDRGTSIYYANSVIPMLPQCLSNGICSLNPNEDRLAFSAFISLDKAGTMIGYSFHKTVIRSAVKGIYTEVNSILSNCATPEIEQKYAKHKDTLLKMEQLATLLTKKRFARGGLDLESTESKIILDSTGYAVDIQGRERGSSERMIEEFMLLANEAAAKFAQDKGIPFVFRVHEDPNPVKISNLCDVLVALGIDHAPIKNNITQSGLAKILKSVEGQPVQKLVNNSILRSMAKAKYSNFNVGHFGLVLKDYGHFTSPIRRYPDLTIHRILSAIVTGMRHDNIVKRFEDFAKQSAIHSSAMELRAMTIERDCEAVYKAEYMKKHLGESFEGIISSVVSHGIYIELENTVEGLVRERFIGNGNCEFDGKLQFKDLDTGKTYRVGDKVTIIVAGVEISSGQIDFELA